VAEAYQRYFVPAIGAPVAEDLMQVAGLRFGERVLDVACGTGVVTRLAARQVSAAGTVAGLDVNPDMLAAARAATPPDLKIAWHQAGAEDMPLPDASFDVVLCQMGLQFIPDRPAALREVRRVLAPGGRLVFSVPGPTPPPFVVLEEALGRHFGAPAAGFMGQVFSLHDTAELQGLLDGAGFQDVSVQADTRSLRVPRPTEFLWQYVRGTPLAPVVGQAPDELRGALQRDVVAGWEEFVEDHALVLPVRMVVATARQP